MVDGIAGAEQAASVATAVFRETQEIPKRQADELVEAVPEASQPSAGSSPDDQLGQNIDLKA